MKFTRFILATSAICASAILASEPADIVFQSSLDGTGQRYVELLK